MSVYWLISAAESLRKVVHRLEGENPDAFQDIQSAFNQTLAATFPGQVILVRDRLSGYRDFDGLGILLVEVQPEHDGAASSGPFHSPSVYIVKVAMPDRLQALETEMTAWDSARPPHLRSDNMFVSLDPFPPRGEGPPQAIVYGDAAMVLGSRNVMSLEEAIFRACRFGQPNPHSIIAQIKYLYDRLATHFFARKSRVNSSVYLGSAALPPLTTVLQRWREPLVDSAVDPLATVPAVSYDQYDDERHQIRRETLALLASHHPVYADPIDVLTGLWEQRDIDGRLPVVHRGYAHGDLHARNVEVAILDDAVMSCALFDYESFRRDNFIAWDFIKLEVELATRLLPADGAFERQAFVHQCLTYWQFIAARSEELDQYAASTDDDDIDSLDAKNLLPNDRRLAVAVKNLPKSVQRLAGGALAIRRMAQRHLGGGFDWLREYDFMLCWYLLRAGLYPNYDSRMTTVALVGAGVSARRLIPESTLATEASRPVGETCYRPRFLRARQLARSGDAEQLNQGVEELTQLQDEYSHVLEIDEELALAYLEEGNQQAAEQLLNSVLTRYRSTSEEVPARFGSLWKRQGIAGPQPDDNALRRALEFYEKAEALQGGYFPAINVATLNWLLGNRTAAREHALRVLSLLDQVDVTRDSFWHHATQGEARLLLGDDIKTALRCYQRAAQDPDCTRRDRQSMRRQLEWLREHLDEPYHTALIDSALDQLFPDTREVAP
ncbi:MAG: tetratricopeptide repeat-containing protein [Planctomycetaceae bacterium]